MTKSLEILINGEGNNVNSHDNHTLVYCALPGNHITGFFALLPTSSFVFSWRWYLRWWLRPFWGVTQCFWVFPRYIYLPCILRFPWVSPRYTCYSTPIFLLLICLLLQGCLSQKPRRAEGKLFSLPYTLAHNGHLGSLFFLSFSWHLWANMVKCMISKKYILNFHWYAFTSREIYQLYLCI